MSATVEVQILALVERQGSESVALSYFSGMAPGYGTGVAGLRLPLSSITFEEMN